MQDEQNRSKPKYSQQFFTQLYSNSYALNKLTYIKALVGFETLKIGMHGIMGIFLFVDTDTINFHEAN